MARPNSKYFASVITKLLAHKRKEKIVIDESFKMHLRSNILTKAADVLGSQKTPAGAEVAGKSFFAQWKYLFAAVPTFLLLVFVGSQFLNMPVVVPETEIPNLEQDGVIEPDRQEIDEEPSEETNVNTQVEPTEEDEESSEGETGQGLKTFPGSLVLAPKTLEVEERPTVQPTNQNNSVEFAESNEPQAQSRTGQQRSFQLLGLNVNINPTSHTQSNTNNEVPIFDESVESPVVQSGSQNADPTIHRIEEDNALTVQSVQEPLVVGTEPETQPIQRIDAVSSVPMPNPAPTANSVEAAEVVQPVYYAVQLSSHSTEKMESKIIPAMAKGKAVQHVTISEREPGVVAVNMRFSSGGETTEFYTFNERTNVWDHVRYVNSSYYDNGLSYTTNFQYSR